MSERLDFDGEEMPTMKLNMAEGREFDSTPLNTTLFTYLGRLACYDHVFIQTGDEDDATMVGTYVFNTHPVYPEMTQFMLENNYPMVLNRIEVPDCDVDAWQRMVAQQTDDLEGGIPDSWLSE